VIDAGGRRIRRLKAGSGGTPLLMIHGFGADHTTWMFNMAELAAAGEVHAIDLPGHGGSEKHVGDGSVESLAEAVLAYMDAAGLESAHLVGHSLGGAIAVEIAATAPHRAAALTLVAPAGFGKEIAQDFIDGFIGESRARKLRPVLEMLVADPDIVTADMVEEVLKFKRLDGALAALQSIASANFASGGQKASMREKLASVSAPVHVVWGEADRVLPAHHAEDLPSSVKVTKVSVSGHIPHMEKAAEVNAVIKGHHPV
jgi:pyruvate dehydrogenase E2 component (dihydrolipoamide acetyltransferase)